MDDRALLSAVLADPDDDLPRLAYADWLDEHGDDDRAEFIRAGVELSHLPPNEDRHAQLAARCRHLEERRRGDWLAGAPPGVVVADFERGFPRRVGPPLRNYTDRLLGREHFAAMKRALELFPLRVFSGRLLGTASSSVARSRQSVYPERGHSPLEILARWPLLERFTALDLGMGGISSGLGDFQPGVAALAESPYAANLSALRLSGLLLGEEAVGSLGASPYLRRLRALDLRYNVPYQDRPAALLETSLPDRLEEIDGLDLETAGRWLRRPGCRLRELGIALDLHGDHPEPADAGPLIGAPGLLGLRRLSLAFDGPAAWQDRAPERNEGVLVERLWQVLDSPLLERLDELDLCGVWLSDLAVAQAGMARKLGTLRLRRCELTGTALAHLRPLLAEGRLRRLDLSYNYLTTADAAALAGWPELARLHELRLDFNDVEDAGLAALRASPHRRPWLRLSG
jgi:uncharacterized protein (TIGR02996 family)